MGLEGLGCRGLGLGVWEFRVCDRAARAFCFVPAFRGVTLRGSWDVVNSPLSGVIVVITYV